MQPLALIGFLLMAVGAAGFATLFVLVIWDLEREPAPAGWPAPAPPRTAPPPRAPAPVQPPAPVAAPVAPDRHVRLGSARPPAKISRRVRRLARRWAVATVLFVLTMVFIFAAVTIVQQSYPHCDGAMGVSSCSR